MRSTAERSDAESAPLPSELSPPPMPTAMEARASRASDAAKGRSTRFGRAVLSIAARTASIGGAVRALAVTKGRPRRIGVAVAAVVAVGCVVPIVALRSSADGPKTTSSSAAAGSKIAPTTLAMGTVKPYVPAAGLAGLDLRAISIDDTGAVATAAGGRIAHLTLDPKLQLFATKILAKHKVPEASIVVIEPSTGKILAYVSRGGDGKDLAIEAFAPSASVFKIVTGAALVQTAGVPLDTKTCYSGGEQKILASDLKDDPKHDIYCATLPQAMGRSLNAVFAKLASRKLSGSDLQTMATSLGYASAIPFDVTVEPSKLEVPTDPLEFARTAAGFWHTTLSPLHGALLASTVANGGATPRPWIVSDVVDGSTNVYKAAAPSVWKKAIEAGTAASLEKMMTETVAQGTSYKAFHDAKGKAFLPGIEVAGKTGTLDQAKPVKLFTWFVGYAPIKNPKIAIATLVANDPVWKVKANVIAREVMQAYFAAQGSQGVQTPSVD